MQSLMEYNLLSETNNYRQEYYELDIKTLKLWQFTKLKEYGNTVLSREQFKNKENIIKEMDKIGISVLIYKSRYDTPIIAINGYERVWV